MVIEGPFTIGIVENPETLGRELHLSFTPAFQSLDSAARTAAFVAYLDDLRTQMAALGEDDQNRAGMATILQVAEQLLPHLEADEIPLEETIVLEIQPGNPLAGIIGGELH